MHTLLNTFCCTWCSQRALMMKKSSMHTAPNGRTPPRAIANAGWVYHICSGTCLFVRSFHRSMFHVPCSSNAEIDREREIGSGGHARGGHAHGGHAHPTNKKAKVRLHTIRLGRFTGKKIVGEKNASRAREKRRGNGIVRHTCLALSGLRRYLIRSFRILN